MNFKNTKLKNHRSSNSSQPRLCSARSTLTQHDQQSSVFCATFNFDLESVQNQTPLHLTIMTPFKNST